MLDLAPASDLRKDSPRSLILLIPPSRHQTWVCMSTSKGGLSVASRSAIRSSETRSIKRLCGIGTAWDLRWKNVKGAAPPSSLRVCLRDIVCQLSGSLLTEFDIFLVSSAVLFLIARAGPNSNSMATSRDSVRSEARLLLRAELFLIEFQAS